MQPLCSHSAADYVNPLQGPPILAMHVGKHVCLRLECEDRKELYELTTLRSRNEFGTWRAEDRVRNAIGGVAAQGHRAILHAPDEYGSGKGPP